MRSLSRSLIALALSAPLASGSGFSVTGAGGVIPDPSGTPGTWNASYSGASFTSPITLTHPVASASSLVLGGLHHSSRGDLHVLLHGPQGAHWNLVVRPGSNGSSDGDAGQLSTGDYVLVESGGASLSQGSTHLSPGTFDQYLNTGGGQWSNGVSNTPLSAIRGPAGVWTLEIRDWSPQDVGGLAGWTLNGVEGGFATYCPGDGTLATACPCAQNGSPGRGCANSGNASGAVLVAEGLSALDNVSFHSAGEPASALTVLLQGTSNVAGGVHFGDGLRCVGGTLKRLYVRNATNGICEAPLAGEPSVRARSALLGDPIADGTARYYQAYYRDSSATFCPAPQGATWNVTNAVAITW